MTEEMKLRAMDILKGIALSTMDERKYIVINLSHAIESLTSLLEEVWEEAEIAGYEEGYRAVE